MGHGKYIDPIVPGTLVRRIGAGERVELDYLILPGESRTLDLAFDLVGEGAELRLRCLYLSRAGDDVHIRVLVHHRVPGCFSRETVKGIAADGAQVKFEGRIVVAPDAVGTEAYQENHNILLSDGARVETLPTLEIYADDVKCSHGATVGQLDADALFYLRSRGIPEAEARELQMLSFLSEVTPAGREEEIAAALRSL